VRYQIAVRGRVDGDEEVDNNGRYHNEADTGKAINSFLSGKANSAQLTRKDIWYTSKLGM